MDSFNIWSNILIPLISSLMGGGLTLIGVVMTINHTNKIRKDDYKENFKPVIRIRNSYDNYDTHSKVVASNKTDGKQVYGIFTNTDKANFEVEGLYVNSSFYEADINRYIRKSEDFQLLFHIKIEKPIYQIILKILDDYNNQYFYSLKYNINTDGIYINDLTLLETPPDIPNVFDLLSNMQSTNDKKE